MSAAPAFLAELARLAVRDRTDARAWLQQASAEVRAASPAGRFDVLTDLCARCRREVGETPLDEPSLPSALGSVATRDWTNACAARVLLLLEAAGLEAQPSALIGRFFREADTAEQASVVRALPWLEPAAAFKPMALQVGRTNSAPLFAALALGTPYPAALYDEREFNQLVLKALFLDLPIEHIVGLGVRANPELSRMCADYVEEREAARRTVPADIWLAAALHPDARVAALLTRYRDQDPHRRYIRQVLGDGPH